jgi:hypothetical protein
MQQAKDEAGVAQLVERNRSRTLKTSLGGALLMWHDEHCANCECIGQ